MGCANSRCCASRGDGSVEGAYSLEDWANETPPSAATTEGDRAPLTPAKTNAARTIPRSLPRTLPEEILASVLEIERACKGDEVSGMENKSVGDAPYQVTRLVDEADFRYCVCYSHESPVVIGYLWVKFSDIFLSDLHDAIMSPTERAKWDPNSRFRLLKDPEKDDPLCEDVFTTIMRAPWPFWDRETLQKRWVLPLPGGGEAGSAILCQSFLDEAILPECDSKVRANYHKVGTVLRPLNPTKPTPVSHVRSFFGRRAPPPPEEAGVEITVCGQLDLGGVIPHWAVALLSRNTSKRCRSWADRLRTHCWRKKIDRMDVV